MKSNGSLRGIITIKWEQSWGNYFLKEKRHVCSILWLMLSKKDMFSKSNWNIKSTFYKHIIAHSHQKWTSCNFTQGIFQNNNLQNQEMLVNMFINIYSWKAHRKQTPRRAWPLSLFSQPHRFSGWTCMRRKIRSFQSAAKRTAPSGSCSQNRATMGWTRQYPTY